jgi:hypothetical protein
MTGVNGWMPDRAPAVTLNVCRIWLETRLLSSCAGLGARLTGHEAPSESLRQAEHLPEVLVLAAHGRVLDLQPRDLREPVHALVVRHERRPAQLRAALELGERRHDRAAERGGRAVPHGDREEQQDQRSEEAGPEQRVVDDAAHARSSRGHRSLRS